MTVRVHVSYFSDVLCVWAYASQVRLDELKRQFGSQIDLSYHFIPIFGCTAQRVGEGWRDRGGFPGYRKHVEGVFREFPQVDLGPAAWKGVVPASSAMSHHFLKAVQILEGESRISAETRDDLDGRTLFEETAWRIRLAFFRDGMDVSTLDGLMSIADELSLPTREIGAKLENGEAMAAMCRDVELRDQYRVEGSPTYVLNEGRQKLYGNVGYKIIEANVQEVLNRPEAPATWC